MLEQLRLPFLSWMEKAERRHYHSKVLVVTAVLIIFFFVMYVIKLFPAENFLGGIQTDGHSNSARIQRVVKVHSSLNCERGISVAG